MPEFRWGYKIGWLAIRSADQWQIARTLKAEKLRRVPWEEGVNAAYKRRTLQAFISSSVNLAV